MASGAPRGRPRNDIDLAVLRTARDQLVARGYSGFSVEAVAEAAGVAKTTLYRRWPTRDHLAVAVVAQMMDDVEVPDTGDLQADVTDYLEQIAIGLNRMRLAGQVGDAPSPSAGLVAELVAAAARHHDIGELVRMVFAQRNAVVLGVIDRARQDGRLRPDADPEVIFDQLAGALYYRLLVTGRPIDRAYAERLVPSVLGGALSHTEKETPP
jgi:AcrR family transcriptional regulator